MDLSRVLTYKRVNVILALLFIAGGLGLFLHARLFRPEPVPYFASDRQISAPARSVGSIGLPDPSLGPLLPDVGGLAPGKP